MRQTLIAALALAAAMASPARATPYFRTLLADPAHPQINVGACADPVNVGHSSQCSVVALVTHSHADGYLLFHGEDWTLLSVGYTASGEGYGLVLGPSWNVTPAFGSAAAQLAHAIAPGTAVDEAAAELDAANQGGHLNISFGPAWSYNPIVNKGYFRLFAGAAWKF